MAGDWTDEQNDARCGLFRDAHNRALGRAGEDRVVAYDQATLRAAERTDLADRIRCVSRLDGDGAGYDILSFDIEGSSRLIEVKTTNGWERTPFHFARAMSSPLPKPIGKTGGWCDCGTSPANRAPSNCARRPQRHVTLMATTYQASFP
jgi:hypothetical protein